MKDDPMIYTGPTNGITYFRCAISDMDLVERQVSVLPIYSDVISNIGAAGKSYQQCDLQKMLRTGKFSVSAFVAPNMESMDKYRYGTLLHSSCLNHNIPYMYSLWQDMFSDPNFHETDRIRTLVDSEISGLTDRITQSGHQYALRRARSHIGPIGEINEQLSGFRQANTLAEYHSGNTEDLISKIAVTHILHCDRSLMSVAINTTPDMMEENLEALEQFLGDIPDRVSGKEYGIIQRDIVAIDKVKEYVEVPNLGINFCARAYRTVPLLHPDSPYLTVLQTLLGTKFLHKEIREKGGAYGSGAMVAQHAFSLFSYRDPNTTRTLDTFDKTTPWIIDGNYSDEDLEECKITAVGKRHAPQAPGSRGLEEFLDGMNLEQRSWFKDQMLSTTREDLRNVAAKYLSDGLYSNVIVGDSAMTDTFKDLEYSIEKYGHKS